MSDHETLTMDTLLAAIDAMPEPLPDVRWEFHLSDYCARYTVYVIDQTFQRSWAWPLPPSEPPYWVIAGQPLTEQQQAVAVSQFLRSRAGVAVPGTTEDER